MSRKAPLPLPIEPATTPAPDRRVRRRAARSRSGERRRSKDGAAVSGRVDCPVRQPL